MNICIPPRALLLQSGVSPEELSALARSIARVTALDPRPVRRALLGERVRDSTRIAVERALRELERAAPQHSAPITPPPPAALAPIDTAAHALNPSDPTTP
ncbi:MAG: hypothetical protein R3A48_04040 [Polyangiales bacterium]